ncbi:lef-1 protein [Thysanoplusia orichalcea nucleopolyhedrovirus]|uniref:Lef-1 protein n=1 Tax=Thysanoplusia orichalcea nucleopolyhedrovirus TaxID=101850 RepID=L0CJL2_9ABAC|nr:lef-1 protein [Thysanoplusia orichalcea nucleopolyhedrovirus]AGA16169.1 lef-1 protein [Thysanoplusia orichalcea nucleopolyhedrovirus]
MLLCSYTQNRVNLMWDAIAYNDARKYAFMTVNMRWIHADKYFDGAVQLYNFIVQNKVADVHIKSLDDGGGREWVIDADYKDCVDEQDLMLKIYIGATAFLLFYTADNVSRVMYTGNRGFHLWLKFTDRFKLTSSQSVRAHRFQAFEKPSKINCNDIRQGSFAYCVQEAVRLYVDNAQNSSDLQSLMLQYWPDIDRDIFCNPNKQIRAPHSYNYKGSKFSRCITKELLNKLKQR